MLSEWLSLLLSALALWAVIFSVYVVSERRTPASTISWVLALGFVPIVGFLVYYAFGPRRFDRKKRRRAAALKFIKESKAGAADAPDEHDEETFLVAMHVGALGASAQLRKAELSVFFSGDEAYASILEAIAGAKHHVNMEYYIWEPDRIGTRLRDALVASAKRGVEVRLHLDGVGSAKANRRFWRPLLEAGGNVKHFNRLALRRRTGNFRTPRKIVVVDGCVGFSGGMNVTDVHAEEFSGEENWRDTHVRIEGPATRGLQMVFNEGWYDSEGELLEGEAFFPQQCASESAIPMQVVSSGPDETNNAIHKLIASGLFASLKRVYITTPYFVPDPTICDALTSAALRGADVRLLVPRKNDLLLIGAASRSYYPELLDVGVRIFEYGPRMVHAKTMVVDDWLALIGTANVDNRSFRLNFEVGIASYEAEVCEKLVDAFRADLEHAHEVTREEVRNYSAPRRLGQSFARLFSPLL